jgi:hypothetical protein
MHAVFVVPGIMGTELLLPGSAGAPGEKVWPPTPAETQLGYKRREKLASPLAKPGKMILNVLCFDFYKPLLSCLGDLGFTANGATQRLVEFPYDWRRDLFDTAGALAGALDAVHTAGASRISVIGHSMGGLICRLVLESDTWKSRPWFGSIDQFIAVATPHLGAPLALGRVHQCHCTVYLSQVFRPSKGWVYSKGTSGGGIIINSTCHLLFLLQWFFGDVTGVFARHDVSIRAAEQEGNGPEARLVFITHEARESAVQATVRELRDLDVVRNVGGLLRVIGS